MTIVSISQMAILQHQLQIRIVT